jgi:DNA polymerase alpha subunit A
LLELLLDFIIEVGVFRNNFKSNTQSLPPYKAVAMSSRTKRTTGLGKKKQKLSALDQLRKAREGGGRNDQYVEEEEEDVYDVLDEEKYRELVKSRQQREDFVVDDDDLGYADDGEDHLLNDQQQKGGRRNSGASSSSQVLLLPLHARPRPPLSSTAPTIDTRIPPVTDCLYD